MSAELFEYLKDKGVALSRTNSHDSQGIGQVERPLEDDLFGPQSQRSSSIKMGGSSP